MAGTAGVGIDLVGRVDLVEVIFGMGSGSGQTGVKFRLVGEVDKGDLSSGECEDGDMEQRLSRADVEQFLTMDCSFTELTCLVRVHASAVKG
jgi:hypothetical protein